MAVLPILQYPRTENAIVTVTTIYYGADPDVVAGFITTPLENAIAQANGIDYMTLDQPERREHDHRQPAAQLRFRQGADRDQHQGQLGPEPAADRIAAADPDRQGRPDHRRHVYRLQQRRAGRQPDHRLPGARGAAQAAGGARRADRGAPGRQDVRAARLARSAEARRLRADRDRREPGARRQRLHLRASAPPRARWSRST